MTYYILSISFALVCTLILFFYPSKFDWRVYLISALGGSLIAVISVFSFLHLTTSDIEIINGKVIEKTRKHGSYIRSYSCFCTTDSKGVQTCQTCYEDRYTVSWDVISTVGDFNIKNLDETSRSVYDEPDPPDYTSVVINEPAAARQRYTNYVQTAKQSLFYKRGNSTKFNDIIPNYPDKIYDRWKNDRVLTAGISIPDVNEWNTKIAEGLKDLGPQKQVNLIFLLAKTNDPTYEYAIAEKWEGGNKNDVIVIIGAEAFPTIDFVRVMSWTKNELFKVELRDAISKMGSVDDTAIDVALTQISKNFERRRMREFEYLKEEVSLSNVGILLTLLLVFSGNLFLMFKGNKFF